MVNTWPIQNTFARGELSPRLHARADIEHWRMGLAECVNWMILRQGGLRRRPGTEDVGALKVTAGTSPVRLIPFVFTRDQSYIIELSHLAARFWNPLGGLVMNGMVPYEIVTPWFGQDLDDLHFAQSADVMTFTHDQYPPVELSRLAETNWQVKRKPFEDGPYDLISRNVTTLRPEGTGDVCVGGTPGNSPGSTAGNDDVNAFDGDDNTFFEANSTDAVALDYNFPAPIVICGYALMSVADTPPSLTDAQAGKIGGFSAPRTWTFEAYDGVGWVILDQRAGELGWGPKERRYYTFKNEGAYQNYRLNVTERNDSEDQRQALRLTQMQMLGYGDDAGQIRITALNVTELNQGRGFLSGDEGRLMRLFTEGARWAWVEILAVESTTSVIVAVRGGPLPNARPIAVWRMGAFGLIPGYPARVAFYQQRIAFARTSLRPQTLWLSQTGNYPNFGPTTGDDGQLLPDGGVEFSLTELGEISFLAESQELLIGTIAAARIFGSADKNAGFSATNFTNTKAQSYAFAAIQPVLAHDTAICVARNRQALREFKFNLEQGKYTAEDITVLSEHIYRRGVRQMAWAEDSNAIIWILLDDGTLAAVTYEPGQKMVAMGRHVIGGGAFVESICVVPGLGRDELWLAVRRVVDGVPRRRMERLSVDFEGDTQDESQAVYLDSARRYEGAPVSAISGVAHLAGIDVGMLADGAEEHRIGDGFSASTLAPGFVPTTMRPAGDTLTIPSGKPASVVTVGVPYVSRCRTLRVSTGQDGTVFGRHGRIHNVIVDVMEAKGLVVKTQQGEEVELILRSFDDVMGEAPPLYTGTSPMTYVDDGWSSGGQLTIASASASPATIRAIILEVESEGPEQGVR